MTVLANEPEQALSSHEAAAPAIRLEAVTKVYGRGPDAVVALDNIDLTVEADAHLPGSRPLPVADRHRER